MRRVRYAGQFDALKSAELKIDLTLNQGGGSVDERLAALTATCKQILVLQSQLRLSTPTQAPKINASARPAPTHSLRRPARPRCSSGKRGVSTRW